MSIVKVEPPQTYSRLFRPWDVKSAKDTNSPDLSLHSVNSAKFIPDNLRTDDVTVNRMLLDKSLSPDYLPFDYVPAGLNCYGYENAYGPLLGVPSPPDFCYPGTMPVPVLGMDGAGITKAMEQEYLRVLTEDAQTKAANSRKQRPKKFKCTHCNVAFSNNGQLKGHIRIHTGKTEFFFLSRLIPVMSPIDRSTIGDITHSFSYFATIKFKI